MLKLIPVSCHFLQVDYMMPMYKQLCFMAVRHVVSTENMQRLKKNKGCMFYWMGNVCACTIDCKGFDRKIVYSIRSSVLERRLLVWLCNVYE